MNAHRQGGFAIALMIAALLLPVAPAIAQPTKQEEPMNLYRNGTRPSQQGSAEWFTGTVRIDGETGCATKPEPRRGVPQDLTHHNLEHHKDRPA